MTKIIAFTLMLLFSTSTFALEFPKVTDVLEFPEGTDWLEDEELLDEFRNIDECSFLRESLNEHTKLLAIAMKRERSEQGFVGLLKLLEPINSKDPNIKKNVEQLNRLLEQGDLGHLGLLRGRPYKRGYSGLFVGKNVEAIRKDTKDIAIIYNAACKR